MPSSPENPLRVALIVGSTREGRAGERVADWFTGVATGRDDLEVHLVDLVDFRFPARYPDRPTPAVREFAARIAAADAFVVVTPEYNRSFPAPLKEAIDYAYDEWHAKPVGFVSYGCRSDGTYAVEQLRVVFTELQAVTMRDAVGLDLLNTPVEAPGWLASDGLIRSATRMLDRLTWWGRALREARTRQPYLS